jgi:hypothetical protein
MPGRAGTPRRFRPDFKFNGYFQDIRALAERTLPPSPSLSGVSIGLTDEYDSNESALVPNSYLGARLALDEEGNTVYTVNSGRSNMGPSELHLSIPRSTISNPKFRHSDFLSTSTYTRSHFDTFGQSQNLGSKRDQWPPMDNGTRSSLELWRESQNTLMAEQLRTEIAINSDLIRKEQDRQNALIADQLHNKDKLTDKDKKQNTCSKMEKMLIATSAYLAAIVLLLIVAVLVVVVMLSANTDTLAPTTPPVSITDRLAPTTPPVSITDTLAQITPPVSITE